MICRIDTFGADCSPKRCIFGETRYRPFCGIGQADSLFPVSQSYIKRAHLSPNIQSDGTERNANGMNRFALPARRRTEEYLWKVKNAIGTRNMNVCPGKK